MSLKLTEIYGVDFSNWQNNHPGDNFMPPVPEHTIAVVLLTKLKANTTSPEVVRFADFSFTIRKRLQKRPLKMLLLFRRLLRSK